MKKERECRIIRNGCFIKSQPPKTKKEEKSEGFVMYGLSLWYFYGSCSCIMVMLMLCETLLHTV